MDAVILARTPRMSGCLIDHGMQENAGSAKKFRRTEDPPSRIKGAHQTTLTDLALSESNVLQSFGATQLKLGRRSQVWIMPYSATVFRIMLSGPGDTKNQRELAEQLIDEWNRQNSFATNALLAPVQWEMDATPAYGDHPQTLLNQQLVDTSDAVIAIFNMRLGSATRAHVSGTAEEIAGFASQGKDTLVYFNSGAVPRQLINDPQREALDHFRQDMRHKGLYFEFENDDQLGVHLRSHIARLAHSLLGKTNIGSQQSSDTLVVDVFWRQAISSRVQWEGMARNDVDLLRALGFLDEHREQLTSLLPAIQGGESEPLQKSVSNQVQEIEALISEFQNLEQIAPYSRRRFWIAGHSIILRSQEIANSTRDGLPSTGLSLPTMASRFRKSGVPVLHCSRSNWPPNEISMDLSIYNAGSGAMKVLNIDWEGLTPFERIELPTYPISARSWDNNVKIYLEYAERIQEQININITLSFSDLLGTHDTKFLVDSPPNDRGVLLKLVMGRDLDNLVRPENGDPLAPSSVGEPENTYGGTADISTPSVS